MAQFSNSSSHSGARYTTFPELYCLPKLSNGGTRNELISLVVINTFLSVTTTLGNTLILIALQKESSLHAPSKLLLRSLTISDLFVGVIANPLAAATQVLESQKQWDICRYLGIIGFSLAHVFCSVSLLTTTAISVDRLLALQLMLRYRQIVTLKRVSVVITVFWLSSIVSAVLPFLKNYTVVSTTMTISLCLVISVFSYSKIFLLLRHNCTRTTPNQTSRSETNLLDMARYRKTVNSALWVQFALLVCYLPYAIVQLTFTAKGDLSRFDSLVGALTGALIYLNSSLNPILFCWKITEVKQAVKETLRRICGRCGLI